LPLGDDAGKERHDEGLEHRADLDHFLPLPFGHVPYAVGRSAVGACVCPIRYRQVFVSFMALGIAATIFLILDRLDYLKSESQLESVVSRESSFCLTT